ncbi:hypothetical protein [Glaciihabitans sp. dw_435]|uniref:hypothetical protein n=1 Tax=Glaciihabitans sp. dw_435 TaxID=2720081 RepID=UPI001BD339B1|nr:hypothetical protein [Glaciihabitans sp. dw_435]
MINIFLPNSKEDGIKLGTVHDSGILNDQGTIKAQQINGETLVGCLDQRKYILKRHR